MYEYFELFCKKTIFSSCRLHLFFILGCVKPNVYGSNCDTPCPDSCLERKCDITNGACFQCAPGWIGSFCDKGRNTIKI